MGAISCRHKTMRSGGRVVEVFSKREDARWEVDGRLRPQLKVVMWAVREAILVSATISRARRCVQAQGRCLYLSLCLYMRYSAAQCKASRWHEARDTDVISKRFSCTAPRPRLEVHSKARKF